VRNKAGGFRKNPPAAFYLKYKLEDFFLGMNQRLGGNILGEICK